MTVVPRMGRTDRFRRTLTGLVSTLRIQLAAARRTSPVFDVTVGVLTRPRYAADALVAGYLAMRLFVLLFPLAYLVIVGFGLYAGQSEQGASNAVERSGMSATIAQSIASAATGSTRSQILVLIVGLMATAWAGRGALHALRFAHTVPWRLHDPHHRSIHLSSFVASVISKIPTDHPSWPGGAVPTDQAADRSDSDRQ